MTATVKSNPKLSPLGLEVLIGEHHLVTNMMDNSHRCDRCGAQAMVRAVLGNLQLLLCGHHAKANIELMIPTGWKFDDQSERLMS